ncbi:ArsR/SmtB family transcription factor [Nocardiopsis xinjiangensis]|uniref:ArsR/SmtB family transcription factor n=1 Tax=Nocardiopsis xinjiangensis TaxID=124285 RepID=UPI000348D6F1|nr:metalloregulator ArsR/SmtB family transcription factor [Nocardiopsis xinjiangensis]
MAPRTHRHPDVDDVELVTVLFALAEPTRLRIVRMLAGPEGSADEGSGGVSEGAFEGASENERAWKDLDLPIAQSTLSHHLRILREAGLLRSRTEGTRCFVSLRTEEIDTRFPGLLPAVLNCAETDHQHRPDQA